MKRKRFRISQVVVILITMMLIGVVVLNIVLMYNIAAEQTQEISQM